MGAHRVKGQLKYEFHYRMANWNATTILSLLQMGAQIELQRSRPGQRLPRWNKRRYLLRDPNYFIPWYVQPSAIRALLRRGRARQVVRPGGHIRVELTDGL